VFANSLWVRYIEWGKSIQELVKLAGDLPDGFAWPQGCGAVGVFKCPAKYHPVVDKLMKSVPMKVS